MIPKQAIIAAREAMREVTPPPGVSKAEWLAEHGSFALIAGAIAAAAPHLMAEAWDEGRKHGATYPYGQRGLATDDNPHRPANAE